MSTTGESRPIIGITCYQAPAQWGFWNLPAALVPLGYVERVTGAGGRPAVDVPLLGVCRGMQLLNVAYGGTLEQHLPDVVGHDGHRTQPGCFDLHPVRIRPDSRVGEALGEHAEVSSGHHQGIASVGDGLCATAWADDGSVEALEDPAKRFAVGVLWHPEEGADGQLFAELVAIAGTRSGLHA